MLRGQQADAGREQNISRDRRACVDRGGLMSHGQRAFVSGGGRILREQTVTATGSGPGRLAVEFDGTAFAGYWHAMSLTLGGAFSIIAFTTTG